LHRFQSGLGAADLGRFGQRGRQEWDGSGGGLKANLARAALSAASV